MTAPEDSQYFEYGGSLQDNEDRQVVSLPFCMDGDVRIGFASIRGSVAGSTDVAPLVLSVLLIIVAAVMWAMVGLLAGLSFLLIGATFGAFAVRR